MTASLRSTCLAAAGGHHEELHQTALMGSDTGIDEVFLNLRLFSTVRLDLQSCLNRKVRLLLQTYPSHGSDRMCVKTGIATNRLSSAPPPPL